MWEWLNSLSLNELQTLSQRLFLWTAILGVLTGLLGLAIWRVSSRIAAIQEKQTLISEQNIAEIRQENLKLQVRVEELKKENLDLQIQVENNRVTVNKHLADRDITEQQATILKAILAPLKGQKLTLLTVPNNPEAAKFTEKLHRTIAESGMVISVSNENPFGHQTPRGFGLVVGIKRQNDAQVIRDALGKSGLVLQWTPQQPTGDPSLLELFIGPKD
jgi:hypothetical protein